MRILMITPHYPPDRSGVGDYVALLVKYLSCIGVHATIVTSKGDAPTREEGIAVLPVIDDWSWSSLPRLYALAMAGRYDLVHLQYQNEMYGRCAAIAALPLLLRGRTPTVVTVHDYGTPWPRRVRARAIAGPYGKAWFLVLLLAAARIILTNEQDEQRFVRRRPRYPVPSGRYRTIPVGSNLPPTLARAVDDVDTDLTIGYFGFVNPAKGVETLLDAFNIVHRDRPAARLIMLCTLQDGDPYRATIRRKIEDLGLSGWVRVTGELPAAEAARLLTGCLLVVLPFRDGVSSRRTTLVAALALGCPVVSTRSPIPPRTLRGGRDLVLVRPGDAEATARAILALLDDPERRAMLSVRAREAARAFAWPTIAAHTLDVYREARR